MIDLHFHKRLLEFISSSKRPLVVVLGPTASGKTDFSIALAKDIGDAEIINADLRHGSTEPVLSKAEGLAMTMVEIVNADSRQLYRHLDIGTAKITRDEMQGIPHHLIDVLDPKEEVTAAWYRDVAMKTIDDIHARKKIPMLVGGSMLYISAVIDGLSFPVASDPALREQLEKEYDTDGGVTLHARLSEIDPDTAQGIPRQNKPYVIRALELHELGGKKPSELRQSSDCPYDLFIIGIDRPREELVTRINKRTAELLTGGWIAEVRELVRKGYSPEDPGMKSHGYREIMRAICNNQVDVEMLANVIGAKTRQYAKRQMTWWKGDARIAWITPSGG